MKDDYDRYIYEVRRDEHHARMKADLAAAGEQVAAARTMRGLGYWGGYLIGRYVMGTFMTLLEKTLPVWSLIVAWSILAGVLIALLPQLPDLLLAFVSVGAAVPVYYFRKPIRTGFGKTLGPLGWVVSRGLGLVWSVVVLAIMTLILVQVIHLILG